MKHICHRQVPAEEVHQALLDDGAATLTLGGVLCSLRALEYIYRCAITRRASPSKLRDALSAYAEPGKPLSDTVCAAWESRAPMLLGEEAKPPPLLPRFTSCDWRLGITVASAASPSPLSAAGAAAPAEEASESAPKGLAPFVNLVLQASVPGGGIERIPLEVSLPEFREMAKALRAASRAMASVQQDSAGQVGEQ